MNEFAYVNHCHLYFFSAIGAGAVKANIVVFGADQTESHDMKWPYFHQCVLAVNVGTIMVTFAFAFIRSPTNYYIPYSIATSLLCLSATLFFVGYRDYFRIDISESVLINCFPVLFNALKTRCIHGRNQPVIKYQSLEGSHTSVPGDADNLIETTDSTRTERPLTLLDYAKVENNGHFLDRIVEDVKSLRKAIVVFLLLIPYWLGFNQVCD